MEKADVVTRLMEQMKKMAELAQTFEAAGKVMSKADKVKIMHVEKMKLLLWLLPLDYLWSL